MFQGVATHIEFQTAELAVKLKAGQDEPAWEQQRLWQYKKAEGTGERLEVLRNHLDQALQCLAL